LPTITRADLLEVGFYHCTRQPAARIAVRLAALAYGSGQRLLIVGAPERLEALDTALWVDDPESFLPHALAGGEHDADQPILLSETPDPANNARLLMVLETGLPAEFDRFDRVLNLFDDGSDAHLRARTDWKAIADREGVERVYWQQSPQGKWERQG